MRKRATSFGPVVATVVLATAIAAGIHNPVLAESACLENPGQQSTKGAHWYYRSDRATGRKCWYVVDESTNAHDAATSQGQATAAPTDTLSSRLANLFGSLTGATTAATPQANSTSELRAFQSNAAAAPKMERGVRADQADSATELAEKRTSKGDTPTLTQAKRNALFEEFVRWQESQQTVGRQ